MDEAGSSPRPRRPFFTIAAWFSLGVPMLGTGVAWVSSQPPVADIKGIPVPILAALAVAFGISFVAGCVSLWGVRANGALAILPPALLGILASAVLEVLALGFLVLSNLPGP
jgi:hypothetical protein